MQWRNCASRTGQELPCVRPQCGMDPEGQGIRSANLMTPLIRVVSISRLLPRARLLITEPGLINPKKILVSISPLQTWRFTEIGTSLVLQCGGYAAPSFGRSTNADLVGGSEYEGADIGLGIRIQVTFDIFIVLLCTEGVKSGEGDTAEEVVIYRSAYPYRASGSDNVFRHSSMVIPSSHIPIIVNS